jgi:hypothetical protein
VLWSHMELEDLAKRIRNACLEAVRQAGPLCRGALGSSYRSRCGHSISRRCCVSSSSRFQIANPWSVTVRAARPLLDGLQACRWSYLWRAPSLFCLGARLAGFRALNAAAHCSHLVAIGVAAG